jgi:integrase
MARRQTLSDLGVAALKPSAKRYVFPDPEMPGHYIRVTPNGAKSYVAVARGPNGKQIWATIGTAPLLDVGEARERAREAIKAIKAGADRAGPQSFESVGNEWYKRHVLAKGLRSATGLRRNLDNHLISRWSGRDFASIRRGDVAKLLDQVEDSSGPVAADQTLSLIRNICNWYTSRNENYTSPVVRGMRRTIPKERARKRILDDNELRAVWKQAEANGVFGALVRLGLLTAQRRMKLAAMRWEDVTIDGEWKIPAEARAKGTGESLVLPQVAIDIIRSQPRFGSNPFVLASREGRHITSFSQLKALFDQKVKIAAWTIHDLRRTARSLMSRAGVGSDVAERVMGHALQGVEGIYDRHDYREEKAQALRQLAALIGNIVNPPIGNVVSIAG